METFSALLAICAGNSPVPGEFLAQRPVTRSFGVYFDLSPNKRLSKQLWGWWFETQSRPLWRHCNGYLSAGCEGVANGSHWCSFSQEKIPSKFKMHPNNNQRMLPRRIINSQTSGLDVVEGCHPRTINASPIQQYNQNIQSYIQFFGACFWWNTVDDKTLLIL